MVLKALIIISIMLQTLATIAAIRLVRLTKYNSIWILLIIGMAAMSVTRYGQYVQTFVDDSTAKAPNELYIWLDAVASLCIAVGVLYAHKLFTYIGHLDHQRKLTNKRILTAVLRTEEKFRSRYSRELHDGMGPLLSSAKMSMSVLAKRAEDEENRELIASTSAVIDEAIRSLREISNNLSPQVLNDFGLVRGITNFINKNPQLRTIEMRFDTNLRKERFGHDIEVILYRVICELINNSLKHSGCTKIELDLQLVYDRIYLTYSDNGRGFDTQAVADYGMGMSNLTSRIHSLGGTIEITSQPNKGMAASIVVSTIGENIVNDEDDENE
ncbi:MAG: sensor histidine kinase [Rikenellaceae bacterium]|nr:sensor histidine kinase [Rikenellaceae bacterium]